MRTLGTAALSGVSVGWPDPQPSERATPRVLVLSPARCLAHATQAGQTCVDRLEVQTTSICSAFRRRASVLVRVATQSTNPRNDNADNPTDNHCFAENMMPATHRSEQQHRAADHESRESDGTREPLQIA